MLPASLNRCSRTYCYREPTYEIKRSNISGHRPLSMMPSKDDHPALEQSFCQSFIEAFVDRRREQVNFLLDVTFVILASPLRKLAVSLERLVGHEQLRMAISQNLFHIHLSHMLSLETRRSFIPKTSQLPIIMEASPAPHV